MAKHPVKALPYANDALAKKGISANTIEIHHDKLYAGYVNKRNEIEEALANVDRTKANQIYSQMRGLKHEETFAANGQILHEIYFASMGGDGQAAGEVFDKIKEDFGSYATWEEDFKAAGGLAESGRRVGHLPAPSLRHLRALLLHRLRQRPEGVPRGLHAQHQLARGEQAVPRRGEHGAGQEVSSTAALQAGGRSCNPHDAPAYA